MSRLKKLGGLLKTANWPAAVAYAVGIVAAVLLAYHFLSAPQRAREAEALGRAGTVVADAQQKAATENVRTIDRFHKEVIRIDERTERSSEAIMASPGADQAVSPVLADNWGRQLCLHDDRRDAVCAELLHRDGDSVRPEGEDAPRADPR